MYACSCVEVKIVRFIIQCDVEEAVKSKEGNILLYLHSIRCFPSLRNENRRCCYNIITTISHVISSEGIHGTEKCV